MGCFFGKVAMKTVEREPCYFPKKFSVNNDIMMLPYAAALHIKKMHFNWWAWHTGIFEMMMRKAEETLTLFLYKWKVTKLKISQTGLKATYW